jgi:hypothetical protein
MIRIFTMLSILVLLPAAALAQGSTGGIQGMIYGPQGEVVPYMWIRANDESSLEQARAESTPAGGYELSGLDPGVYSLEIVTPCCAYKNFDREDVQVASGQMLELDIHLKEGGSFNTVGDDPGVIAAALRSEATIPDQPLPRTPEGKPDLSGIWLIGNDPFPEQVDAQDWAQALAEERWANHAIDHPHNQCLPGSAPIPGGAAPFIAKFVQKDDLLVILFEDYPGYRQVFLDGRSHPEYPNPSWVGHSVAYWDDNTLVIDTIGFNDRGWMNSYPRSEELHIVERYTRSEYGRIDLEMTVEDPKVFNKPWKRYVSYHLVPQVELMEYVCENNKWGYTSEN